MAARRLEGFAAFLYVLHRIMCAKSLKRKSSKVLPRVSGRNSRAFHRRSLDWWRFCRVIDEYILIFDYYVDVAVSPDISVVPIRALEVGHWLRNTFGEYRPDRPVCRLGGRDRALMRPRLKLSLRDRHWSHRTLSSAWPLLKVPLTTGNVYQTTSAHGGNTWSK